MILYTESKSGSTYRIFSLKPENVLIDKDGYAKLTDFGLSKEGIKDNQGAKTFCGTPEYLAPEIVEEGASHGKAVDWWSLGCIIYEMLTGQPPFQLKDNNRNDLFKKIKNCDIAMPPNISDSCKDLLQKLFVANPNQRLGGGDGDGMEIMNHAWFTGVDWNMILQKSIKPPFKPKLTSPSDVRYIDETFTSQELWDSPESMKNSLNGGNWPGFTYKGKEGLA